MLVAADAQAFGRRGCLFGNRSSNSCVSAPSYGTTSCGTVSYGQPAASYYGPYTTPAPSNTYSPPLAMPPAKVIVEPVVVPVKKPAPSNITPPK